MLKHMGGNLRVAWFIIFLFSSKPKKIPSPSMHSVCWGLYPITYPVTEFPTFFAVRNSDDDSHLKKNRSFPALFWCLDFFPMIFPMDFVASHQNGPFQGGYVPSHLAARLQRVVQLVASSGAFAALTEGGWAAWWVIRWVIFTIYPGIW